ncbi:MAG: hypothetical protein LBQ89_00170, partial [Treponema sp.]|nr:hypothetical protein [Treponema sp.]
NKKRGISKKMVIFSLPSLYINIPPPPPPNTPIVAYRLVVYSYLFFSIVFYRKQPVFSLCFTEEYRLLLSFYRSALMRDFHLIRVLL